MRDFTIDLSDVKEYLNVLGRHSDCREEACNILEKITYNPLGVKILKYLSKLDEKEFINTIDRLKGIANKFDVREMNLFDIPKDYIDIFITIVGDNKSADDYEINLELCKLYVMSRH